LAKAHSIQFYALKKSTFFSKYLIDIVLGLTSPLKCREVEKNGSNGILISHNGNVEATEFRRKKIENS